MQAANVRPPDRGIGRRGTRAAELLSDELRLGSGPELRRRRAIVGLSALSAGAMLAVSLYQVGLLRHLPDPPLLLLDSDAVDASGEAYVELHMPDAPLGLLGAAITIALASAGGADRAQRQPWLPLLLAAKTATDAAMAVGLTVEQGTRHRRFCSYCLVAAVANAATAPLSMREARRAWRSIRARS